MHENHRARMQARVERDGLESLAEHEALEYLLFLAIPRQDTNELAHRLIQHFGDFCKVMEAEPDELMQVEGIGPKSARLIATVMAFSRYYDLKKRKVRPVSYTHLGQSGQRERSRVHRCEKPPWRDQRRPFGLGWRTHPLQQFGCDP